MTANIETLLIALCVFCDDHVIGRRRIGRPPLLSDAELLCPAIARVLLGFPGERHRIRCARKNLRHLFPYIPDQSGYGKRLRAAGPLTATVIRKLAEVTETGVPVLRLIDSTPVPCGMSRETAKRSDLAGDAGYGYCASHSRYFWGMRLYLVTTVEGMPVTWCLAHPKLGEREVTAALLEIDRHLVQSGQVILADKGFAGCDFETFLDHLGVHLVRPARSNTSDPAPSQAERRLLRLRQWIEAIFDTLKGQLSLEQHGSRARHGIYTRVGQRLLAMAACIWHNTNIGALSKRSLIATTTDMPQTSDSFIQQVLALQRESGNLDQVASTLDSIVWVPEFWAPTGIGRSEFSVLSRAACCDSAEPTVTISSPLVQAAAPVLKVGQQISVRHAFSSVVS